MSSLIDECGNVEFVVGEGGVVLLTLHLLDGGQGGVHPALPLVKVTYTTQTNQNILLKIFFTGADNDLQNTYL